MNQTSQASVSVVGARGYAGLELVRLLLKHPVVKLTHAFATRDFQLSDDLLEEGAKSVLCLPESQLMKNLTDFVFLATPAEVSLHLAPQILAHGKTVIDLSGAFRLKKNDTQKWYGFEQTAPAELAAADYGLSPFCGPLNGNAKLIANPGCYATAVSLALIPLLKHKRIDISTLTIDAKSGTTGAGRKAAENLLYSEVEGGCLPYRVGRHQHTPEIQEAISLHAGVDCDFSFVTHLLPVKRGIIAGIYAKTDASLEQIQKAYQDEYENYPLVRHGPQIAKLARLDKVVGTPFTHLSYEVVDGRLYAFATLDNLLKGAASQAVENLNRCLDLPFSFTLMAEG